MKHVLKSYYKVLRITPSGCIPFSEFSVPEDPVTYGELTCLWPTAEQARDAYLEYYEKFYGVDPQLADEMFIQVVLVPIETTINPIVFGYPTLEAMPEELRLMLERDRASTH